MSAKNLFFVYLVLNFIYTFCSKNYGTKTLYEESFDKEEWEDVLKAKLHHPETCHPIYLSAIFRLGLGF